jgi:hypothetical protein
MNKLCNVASCWIYEYIGILLGARPILHISRIKVKNRVHAFLAVLSRGDITRTLFEETNAVLPIVCDCRRLYHLSNFYENWYSI